MIEMGALPAEPVVRRHAMLHALPRRMRVYSHDRGGFHALRNERVLLYWPHGFGDWVQFSYILRILEPSNKYWIARFGDDNTSVMEGNPHATPIYLGMNSTHVDDGGKFGLRHFGLKYEQADGGEHTLLLPLALHAECVRHSIASMLWSSFPEPLGYASFPFHSKPRNLIQHLVPRERIDESALSLPLKNSICFDVPEFVTRWVEARLRSRAGFGERKLCLIGRNGYTSIGKNWGHLWREDMPAGRRLEGEESRDFIRAMLTHDPRWLFLAIEDRLFEGEHTLRSAEFNTFSYAELFGANESSGITYGMLMKALANLADLSVGVPAGPHHLCMAKPGLPVLGLWIEHLPQWFDEPKQESLHVLSRNIRDRGLDRRIGSAPRMGSLHYECVQLDSRILGGDDVFYACRQLLGGK